MVKKKIKLNRYKCKYCNKIVTRAGTKIWIKSFCQTTDRETRLYIIKK